MLNPPSSAVGLLNKLKHLKRKANGGFIAACPAHEDRHPSLSIDFQDDRILVKCMTGCATEAVMRAIGLETSDLFADATSHAHSVQGRETIYHITESIEHVRIDYPDGTKSFIWRMNGKVGLKGIKTEDLPLYGLARIGKETAEGAKECLILCEGEKAADALWTRGWAGLGTVTGAAGCPSPEMLLPLSQGFPILWPDEDEPGLKHMERVARNIAFGSCPFVIRVPGAKKGEDAADYAGDIGDLVGAAIPWEPGMLWKESETAQPENKLGGFF